jgi:error-prone DNA polymerase
MGWNNPDIPWREFERRLSWGGREPAPEPPPRPKPVPRPRRPGGGTGWAELHCHSSYSFLDGASSPQELIDEAVRLGVEALAVTDHDGMYGAVQLKEAAKGTGVGTIFGAELTLDLPKKQGEPDPGGRHLLVLARDVEGYGRLSGAITKAQLAGGEKGRPVYDLEDLANTHDGHWAILTGCRKGLAHADGPEAGLRTMIELFGRENVYAELTDHDQPLDDARNDALYDLARRLKIDVVASNNVHYAAPGDATLAEALAAVRARRGLDDMESWLPATGTAHIRSAEEMTARMARFPGVVERTAELARSFVFNLKLVKPDLPDWRLVPEGHTEATWLRHLVAEGAAERYGPRRRARKAYRQIDQELSVIDDLGFPGYFLIVQEIVEFCRDSDILCQGRGSAANSAVCFALGITGVDAVKHNLLFERFLSPGRDGPPDIDLDIEHRRREEVIQHVYEKYGRDRAAQVANVISYRPRMAVRDAARALGFSPGRQDAWSRQLSPAHSTPTPHHPPPPPGGIPEAVTELADRMQRLPRHLGIHSGGMVICDRPIGEVCPVEWARMPGRTVLQWDKDDCAAEGLVKFDLLGLGMLSALHDTFDLVAEFHGRRFDLQNIPPDVPEVYAMLRDADTVGVFQVESRAQMATLPRLKPDSFYDLVVEVALIRPGPIQGGSVHPYLRRRSGQEVPDIPHPLMRGALHRTMGVPLFQEQMMQLAVDCAGFTPAESDALRQAMSAKRAPERIERLRERLLTGMAERGISGEIAKEVYEKILGFASFGFPESHAQSFAHLVYASSYLKRHYPAAFTAALLRNQPMGFYSPQTLIGDARRHGVRVLGVDVNASADQAMPEEPYTEAGDAPHSPAESQPAIRLGLEYVRNLGKDGAERIAAGRPYESLEDLVRRVPLPTAALEALATAGAFGCFGLGRREALWAAGALSTGGSMHRTARWRADRLPGTTPGTTAPELPAMTPIEETIADLWATGTSGRHPIAHVRDMLDERDVIRLGSLKDVPGETNVLVAGVVTHRQRPGTAGGVIFFNLEDETGMANVVCRPQVWERYRTMAFQAQAMVVHGRLERHDGATNLIATRLRRLPVVTMSRSRDFR